MAKFGVEMKSGEVYEVDAQHGDEAKKKAYDLALKEHPSLAGGHNDGHPSRAVARVHHPA